jgi:hypothetical protein
MDPQTYLSENDRARIEAALRREVNLLRMTELTRRLRGAR